ncbi:hypothetical protein GCM10009712_26510 [Pseudarthrobacter sulfonivorans]|jgi:hypothetical protein|uniref:hypothetical protein n=1 Tax=Pseudarthrobacter sulfonivorans TaxID=121292 RepID=UPI00168B8BC5|nr:hypothetical protein [Pseudarthrobacter sulfonivorans]
MFKKIAAAAVLAGALAFSAAAPAVLSAGSVSDSTSVAVAGGKGQPAPSGKATKDTTSGTITPMSGNWPYPV